MTLRLNGATSGYAEIDAPATAGNNTLILPTGNGTDTQVLATNGSGTLSWVTRGRMFLDTAKASTSGTSVDWTDIPSWVKRITVMFNGVSLSGSSSILVRLGDSGGIEDSGYASTNVGVTGTTGGNSSDTSGLIVGSNSSATVSGHMMLTNISSNTWVSSHSARLDTGAAVLGGGTKSLSATLDRLRVTTVNGTDTFDAGSINLLLEG